MLYTFVYMFTTAIFTCDLSNKVLLSVIYLVSMCNQLHDHLQQEASKYSHTVSALYNITLTLVNQNRLSTY